MARWGKMSWRGVWGEWGDWEEVGKRRVKVRWCLRENWSIPYQKHGHTNMAMMLYWKMAKKFYCREGIDIAYLCWTEQAIL